MAFLWELPLLMEDRQGGIKHASVKIHERLVKIKSKDTAKKYRFPLLNSAYQKRQMKSLSLFAFAIIFDIPE